MDRNHLTQPAAEEPNEAEGEVDEAQTATPRRARDERRQKVEFMLEKVAPHVKSTLDRYGVKPDEKKEDGSLLQVPVKSGEGQIIVNEVDQEPSQPTQIEAKLEPPFPNPSRVHPLTTHPIDWGRSARPATPREDLPRVVAFELESKLRRVVEEVLTPIMAINKENNFRIGILEIVTTNIEGMQTKITQKLDADRKLRDLVEDTKAQSDKYQKETHKEIEDLRRKLMDCTQVMHVHEDRMIRLIDDKKIFELSRDQLRNDIRQFEILAQDISLSNKAALVSMENKFKLSIDSQQDQIETLTESNERHRFIIDMQKDKYQDFQNQLAWDKYNIDALMEQTEDVPALVRQNMATEKYLHKILPITIETQIYNSTKNITDSKQKKDLQAYTVGVVNQLLKDHQDEELEFDKKKLILPEIKGINTKIKIKDDSPRSEALSPAVKIVARGAGSRGALSPGPSEPKSPSVTDKQSAQKQEQQSQSASPKKDAQSRDGTFESMIAMHPELFQNPEAPSTKNMKFTRKQVDKLAHQIGKRFLRNAEYLDDLAEALDGEGMESDLSSTDSDEYASTEEEDGRLPSAGLMSGDSPTSPKMDSPKASRRQSRRGTILGDGEAKKKRSVRFQEDLQDDGADGGSSSSKEIDARRAENARRPSRLSLKPVHTRAETSEFPSGEGASRRSTAARIAGSAEDYGIQDGTRRSSVYRSAEGAYVPSSGSSRRPGQSPSGDGSSRQRESLGGTRASGSRRSQAGANASLAYEQAAAEIRKLDATVADMKRQMKTFARQLQGDDDEEAHGSEAEASSDGAGASKLANPNKLFVRNEEFSREKVKITEIRKHIKELRQKMFGQSQRDGDSQNEARIALAAVNAKTINDIHRNVEQSVVQIDLLKDEIKIELKRLQRQNFAVNAGFEEQQEFLDRLCNKIDVFEKKLVLSDTSMATIFKLLRIQYALSHQDELDKQEIFLAGTKDAKGGHQYLDHSIDVEQNSYFDTNSQSNHANLFSGQSKRTIGASREGTAQIISFDKSCMLCAGPGTVGGQLPTLMKAFKMACLTYKPSQVIFEQKKFERNQLIEAQGYLLYLAIQHLKHLDFSVVERTLLGSAADDATADATATAGSESPNQTSRVPPSNIMNTTYSLLQPSVDSINSVSDTRVKGGLININKSDSIGNSAITPQASTSFNPMPQMQSKMISIAKSKEYSKLANQIPGIYNIDKGQKILNNNGGPSNTLGIHEKYQHKDIKQFSSSRYSTSTQSRLAQQQPRHAPGGNRASVNVTATAADKQSQHLPSLAFDVHRSMQKGPDAILNEGVMGMKPQYRKNHGEGSTPLIKNKRRYAAGLANEMGSFDRLSNTQKESSANFEIKQRTKVAKLKNLGSISNSQAFAGTVGSLGAKTSTYQNRQNFHFGDTSQSTDRNTGGGRTTDRVNPNTLEA